MEHFSSLWQERSVRIWASVVALGATAVLAFGTGKDVQKIHDTGCPAEAQGFSLSWVEAPAANLAVDIEQMIGITTLPHCMAKQ